MCGGVESFFKVQNESVNLPAIIQDFSPGSRLLLWSTEFHSYALSGAYCLSYKRGWSGGAMVLGKLPVPGRPTIWISVGQGLLHLQ